MKPSLPAVLTLNAGYVDAAGFLALQGLFSAHVTGNFVTLAASLVHGSTGALSKLLALPVFCLAVIATRFIGVGLAARALPRLRPLLALKIVLLALACVFAVRLGPFADADSPAAILTGMMLVAAMGVQNAVGRMHLASYPPTTVMTLTTTQVMLDLADVMRGVAGAEAETLKPRFRRMAVSVVGFALGCGLAAAFYYFAGMWCFAIPPLIACAGLALGEADGTR